MRVDPYHKTYIDYEGRVHDEYLDPETGEVIEDVVEEDKVDPDEQRDKEHGL